MNHLWQSSLFVGVIWILTLALRKNRAAVRYWLWLAASVKFLIPFSLLVGLGSQFQWRTAAVNIQPQVSLVVEEIGRASVAPVVAVAAPGFHYIPVLIGIWFCGFAIGVVLWMRAWLRIRAALRAAKDAGGDLMFDSDREYRSLWSRLCSGERFPVRVSATRMEPGVFGIFRPVLLLPEGIVDRLTPAQLEAIVVHELCHVRRRDNLTGAIHMVVETIFWFHPLVWWIRTRLIDERERACDEEVLRMGSEAEVYAASILEACKLYLESPLVCVSGVTGSDLKKRIEAIMANRGAIRVNFSKKILLSVAAIGAVMGPFAVGVMNAPAGLAQSHAEFEVATVKPVKPGTPENRKITAAHGSVMMQQQTLRECITWAYGLTAASQISGPGWLDSEQYDIAGKAPESSTTEDLRLMLQALLAERFKLSIRHTTEQRPLYALTVGKGGPKLREVEQEVKGMHIDRDGAVTSYRMETNMAQMARILPMFLDHPVLDKTGLTGVYDMTLKVEMEPEATMPQVGQLFHGFGMTPGIFGAVEALGLKLVSEKGPVDVLVVDHAERPSGNDQAAVTGSAPSFEVASIKASVVRGTEGGGRSLIEHSADSLTMRNLDLKECVQWAYGVEHYQIPAPNSLDGKGYDILAKAGGAVPVSQLRLMLRQLLADRFKLAVHRETKTLPVYALTVAKGGPKLPAANVDDGHHAVESLPRVQDGSFLFADASMSEFATKLSLLRGMDRPVVDQTRIAGRFDILLKGAADAVRNDGASLFTLIPEQLGMKLVATKTPLEIVVIDRAERPSEN